MMPILVVGIFDMCWSYWKLYSECCCLKAFESKQGAYRSFSGFVGNERWLWVKWHVAIIADRFPHSFLFTSPCWQDRCLVCHHADYSAGLCRSVVYCLPIASRCETFLLFSVFWKVGRIFPVLSVILLVVILCVSLARWSCRVVIALMVFQSLQFTERIVVQTPTFWYLEEPPSSM